MEEHAATGNTEVEETDEADEADEAEGAEKPEELSCMCKLTWPVLSMWIFPTSLGNRRCIPGGCALVRGANVKFLDVGSAGGGWVDTEDVVEEGDTYMVLDRSRTASSEIFCICRTASAGGGEDNK